MEKRETMPKHRLRRILGLGFGIAVVVGGTIGVGILRNPGEIAALLPDARLILFCWITGGIYVLLAASSYAELTTMLPKAGGAYNYIGRAFGGYPGFVSGWFDYLCNAIPPAYFCIVIAEYLSLLIPALAGNRIVVALGFLSFFTLLNAPGVKGGSIIQQVTTALKILLFLVLIGACFSYGGSAHKSIYGSSSTAGLLKGSLFIAIFRALQLTIGTYDGWTSVSFFAEENTDPGRSVPRSYFIGAITVMVLYVLTNAAMLYVLPVLAMGKSPLVASDAARVVFGDWGAAFITIFSIFSLLSILNTYIMIPARILFGLSRDGYFIKQGAIVNKGGTPIFALSVSFAINFFLVLVSSFDELFSLSAFMNMLVTGLAYASVIQLRRREPLLARPYRAWGYPYSTGITILVTLALLVGYSISDQQSLLIISIVMALSYPAYLWLTRNTGSRQAG